MKRLKDATVHRSGQTASRWNYETDEVEIKTDGNKVELKFCLKSKGGGITDVLVGVGPHDFRSLCSAMIRANRNHALAEMTAAVADEISTQREHDRSCRREARESVFSAAEDAYLSAPAGEDVKERRTRDAVLELVKELNCSDQDSSESD